METMQNVNLKWRNSYSFGIPIIDRQHKKFLVIYDDVANMINTNEQGNNAKTDKIIIELMTHLKTHFQTEEKLMKQAGYPDIDEHIKQHEFFVKKVDEFTISYKSKNTFLLRNVYLFMKKWFLFHMMQTDTEYLDCIKLFLRENPV